MCGQRLKMGIEEREVEEEEEVLRALDGSV